MWFLYFLLYCTSNTKMKNFPQIQGANKGFFTGVVLIAIAVLLGLVALGFFNNEPSYGVFNHRTLIPKQCGLTIYSPKEGSVIEDHISISGYARGCGWTPNQNGDLGTAYILDENGKIVQSQKITVQKEESTTTNAPYYFEFKVYITSAFNQKGLLIIENTFTGTAQQTVSRTLLFRTAH